MPISCCITQAFEAVHCASDLSTQQNACLCCNDSVAWTSLMHFECHITTFRKTPQQHWGLLARNEACACTARCMAMHSIRLPIMASTLALLGNQLLTPTQAANCMKYRETISATTHQLSVKMSQAQHSARHFPHHRKGLDQQVIQRFALSQTLPKVYSLAFELLICELLQLWLLFIDMFDHLNVPTAQYGLGINGMQRVQYYSMHACNWQCSTPMHACNWQCSAPCH